MKNAQSRRLAAWLAIFACVVAFSDQDACAQSYHLVVPAGYSNNAANGYAAGLSQQIRVQQVYPASAFPPIPILITELRYRRYASTPFASGAANVRFRLSTTAKAENALSAVFAENVGTDETEVFDGEVTMSSTTSTPSAPYPFEMRLPLGTAFLYNPAKGNLLIDQQVYGATTIPYIDAAGESGDGVSRIYSGDPDATTASTSDSGGDIIQFVYSPAEDVVFDPPGTTYTNSISVAIYSGIPGGVIRFTTDGSDPGPASPLYVSPIELEISVTLKARSFTNGVTASGVYSAEYVRYYPPDIEFQPTGRWFTNQIAVAMINHLGAGTIRYTLGGAPPAANSPAYLAPFILTESTTVRSRIFLNAVPVSDEFSESFARVYAFEDDGVPFAWRETYFGPAFLFDPCAAVDADCDGDGYTTADEFGQGTIPTDPASKPAILMRVRAVPEVTFTTVPGHSYRVLRATTLTPPDWQVIVENVLATGAELSVVDQAAQDNSYYQIELILE